MARSASLLQLAPRCAKCDFERAWCSVNHPILFEGAGVELKREFGHFDAEAAPATVSGESFAPRAT